MPANVNTSDRMKRPARITRFTLIASSGLLLFSILASWELSGLWGSAPANALTLTQGQVKAMAAPSGAASSPLASSAAQAPEAPAGTGFTYQGSLKDGGQPANGSYDFRFTLFDALTGGSQVGNPVLIAGQAVSNGLFTVTLDFGPSAFQGDARYVQIEVKPAGGPAYTLLTPRQAITPAPYALFALKTQDYKNVVVVAQSGGDYTSIEEAVYSITDNSASNRYLVWVAPGTYTETVYMKPWVDIEGAGENATKITYTGSPSNLGGTVTGANYAELRSLTVENTGGDAFAQAMFNEYGSPSLLHVTAIASGGTTNVGVYNFGASPTINSVTAMASGGTYDFGVYNDSSSSPTMDNVTATASGGSSYSIGVSNQYAAPTMDNVIATAYGVPGSIAWGVYNQNASPTMSNGSATGSGGDSNYGVGNYSCASFAMNNMLVTASGGANRLGIYNSSTSLVMNNVIVNVSGGTSTYGVYNESGSASTIINSNVNGTAYGVYNNTNSSAKISNSVIAGSTNTIYNLFGSASARVGGSQLIGGPVSLGTTCAGVYDENFAFYASSCP